MSFGKKYFLGINITASQFTEQLSQEELLPKNYALQTCNGLENLNTQVGILENQDIYCGAMVTINEISFPLEYEYRSKIAELNSEDIFILLVDFGK